MHPLTFLVGCMGARLALTLLAKNGSKKILKLLSIVTGLISIGFLSIYLLGLRKTGAEVGGREIWWNDLRPMHAFLYGAFSIAAYMGDSNSWILLLLDTVLGLTAYIGHYCM
jgi:hypothetical protein